MGQTVGNITSGGGDVVILNVASQGAININVTDGLHQSLLNCKFVQVVAGGETRIYTVSHESSIVRIFTRIFGNASQASVNILYYTKSSRSFAVYGHSIS